MVATTKPNGPNDANDYSPDTFKILLKKLVQTPNEFTPDDCALAFRHLCVQGASDAQVSCPSHCFLAQVQAPVRISRSINHQPLFTLDPSAPLHLTHTDT